MKSSKPLLLSIDSHVTGETRGLGADAMVANAMGLPSVQVCTSILVASHGHVTDVTEVPTDTVDAQLQHVAEVIKPKLAKVGVLGDHRSVNAVFNWLSKQPIRVLLDFSISGPAGETVLSSQGVDRVIARLSEPDLVSISAKDAELVTGGEINSLDDAQVAAQRLHKRGAKNVLVRCGLLPARFHDALVDPGGDGSADPFMVDLFYDGDEFSLFEAPLVGSTPCSGSSSALHLPILEALEHGHTMEEAIQAGKWFVTESIRCGAEADPHLPLAFDWIGKADQIQN